MPLWMLQWMKILHLFIKAEPKSSIKAAFGANSLLLHCFISSALMHQTMLECSAGPITSVLFLLTNTLGYKFGGRQF
jgi:hypothetical protein